MTTAKPTGPMPRRDVWLTITALIQHGAMPEPSRIEVNAEARIVFVNYDDKLGCADPYTDAGKAALALLGNGAEYQPHPDGGIHSWGLRDAGWSWSVVAYTPAPAVTR